MEININMNQYTLPFKQNDKVIELGGGDNPQFHPNYDTRRVKGVDFISDFNEPLPIISENFDGLFCRYALEHINWRNVKNFLGETYRILKYGGHAVFITSNLLEQAKVLVDYDKNNKEWNDNLIGMIFGAEDYKENTHQSGFSPNYITQILTEIGFKDIKISPIYSDFGNTDMIIETTKPLSSYISSNITDATITKEYKNINTIQSNYDRRQWILNHVKIGEKILDIGSADGWIFKDTTIQQYVTSVDLDKYDIPNFYQMDAHSLKFPDKSFDIANLGEILEHVDDPIQVIKEAKRVAKRVLITVPDEANWSKEYYPYETIEEGMKRRNLTLEQIVKISNPNAIEITRDDNYNHLFHNRHYTEETLRQNLEKAGFQSIDYEMTRIQYGQPRWSFFVVESKEYETDISGQTIFKGPTITQGTYHNYNPEKLRIAIISTPFFGVPPAQYGGLEQIVWDLAEALDELGHEVTLFAPEGSKTPKHGNLVVIGPSLNTVNVDWLQSEKSNYDIYSKHITPDKFDIVHGNGWFAFEYLLKVNNPSIKVLHQHHGGINWSSPPPVPKPNLVSISQFMQNYAEQYFQHKGFSVKSQYVYNGIDLNRYKFDPNIKRTNRLLYVGRYSKFKQPHIAIDLAKKTNHSIDLVGGTFVDDINYLHQIESMCNDDNIVMYKDVPHELKIKKMQEAKALIFPSKMGEPAGLVAIESMACGTPVIAFDDGAIKEYVIHNKTGFICNTIEDMIVALNNIHTIKSEDCRKRAEELSRENMARNYLKLYYQILNGNEW